MVVSDITGGMGNQMFQYACGYALSRKKNDLYMIDISHLSSDYQKNNRIAVPREYQLGHFKITADVLPTLALSENNIFKKVIGRLYRYYRIGSIFQTKFVRDCSAWEYWPNQLEYKKNIYLCGFWQSWRYFDEYRQEIRKEFQIKENELSSAAQNLIAHCAKNVGIHIRRGDYKMCDNWLIDESFYIHALEHIKKTCDDIIGILVFCDEIEFAEKLFKKETNVQYITAEKRYTDLEEFAILSACKYHIISNSTFSWWAAYLGNEEESVTIAPVYRQWKEDYYPNEWIKIDMNR